MGQLQHGLQHRQPSCRRGFRSRAEQQRALNEAQGAYQRQQAMLAKERRFIERPTSRPPAAGPSAGAATLEYLARSCHEAPGLR